MKTTEHCYVKTSISHRERELFFAAARDTGIPHYLLMRHLVRYVLKDDIDWAALLKSIKKCPESSEHEETKKVYMRVQIPPDLYDTLSEFAEKWGSSVNKVMRKLILLYTAGTIKWHMMIG